MSIYMYVCVYRYRQIMYTHTHPPPHTHTDLAESPVSFPGCVSSRWQRLSLTCLLGDDVTRVLEEVTP